MDGQDTAAACLDGRIERAKRQMVKASLRP
jgi:hypothetical protein